MAVSLLHRQLTLDSLVGIGLNKKITRRIAFHVWRTDFSEYRHGSYSCHRVKTYQEEFEKYGGRICPFPGAEAQAETFYSFALLGRDVERNLGFCIHHLQDALCPEHIFPFAENTLLRPFAPHAMYSLYALRYYVLWSRLTKNDLIIEITKPEDLREKISAAADRIRGFPCSYLRQDGQKILDPKAGNIGLLGWTMPMSYTGLWLTEAVRLTRSLILCWKKECAARSLDLAVFLFGFIHRTRLILD